MLLKIQSNFLLIFTLHITRAEHQIIVKLDPEVIIKTLTSRSSFQYLQKLADVFAEKVAERLIGEIKDKDRYINKQDKAIPEEPPVKKKKENAIHKSILDEEQALTLMEKPSPDGDNLDITSLVNSFEVSKEDVSSKKTIPVYSLMKVNGKYVRRFLGLI